MRAQGLEGEFWGMGGEQSGAAGIHVVWPGERLQLLGVVEVLRSVPALWRLKNEIAAEVLRRSPRAVVVVDSPDFHLPLIRSLRAGGYRGRIAYISPPSVWAWRKGRAQYLKDGVDLCLPLFRFEHEYLLGCGCRSFWTGHPLTEEFRFPDSADSLLTEWASKGEIIALLPGSRGSEIHYLFPLLAEVYKRLENQGCVPVFSIAPGLNPPAKKKLETLLAQSGFRAYPGPGRNLMSASSLVIGASGTATLEALLLRKHMVIVYRVHPITALIGRLLLRNPFFGIPNLLAKEELFPEFVQDKATPDAVERAALEWLEKIPEERETAENCMRDLVLDMGNPGVYTRWAQKILTMNLEGGACVDAPV